jgi:hypothetical protein
LDGFAEGGLRVSVEPVDDERLDNARAVVSVDQHAEQAGVMCSWRSSQNTASSCVDWGVFHGWKEGDPGFAGVVTVQNGDGAQVGRADWTAPSAAAGDRCLANPGSRRVGESGMDWAHRRCAPVAAVPVVPAQPSPPLSPCPSPTAGYVGGGPANPMFHHPRYRPRSNTRSRDGCGRPVPVVPKEDNPADIRLTLEAVSAAGITRMEVVVTDGDAALGYLRQEPPYRGAHRQGLVLLDLKLPRVDGRHVLTAIKPTATCSPSR